MQNLGHDPAADEAGRARASTSRRRPRRSASRIGEELDYELEAQNQRSLARIFRGHPFIVVPDVITEPLAREGDRHRVRPRRRLRRRSRSCDQATRDRSARSSSASSSGCMYRHHQFSGDPHPGNFMLLDDGRVAFLDFGLFKVMPKELIELELACQRAGHEGDGERLHADLVGDRLPRASPSASGPTSCSPSSATRRGGTCSTRRSSSRPEIATQVMIDMSRPALGALRPDAPRDAARRPPVRPPRRDAHARRALAAARARELPPDRARVDVRRAAGDRARAAGGRLLSATDGARLAPRWPGSPRSPRAFVAAWRARATSPSERVRDWVDDAGVWAPVAFVARLGVADRRALPRPAAGGRVRAAVRHRARASRSASRAAVLGASVAFLIARTVGRDAGRAARRAARAAGCATAIGRRGFVAVLYARIVPGVPVQPRQLRAPGSTADPAGRRSPPPPRSAPPRARSPTRRSAARSTTSARPRRSSPSPCSS